MDEQTKKGRTYIIITAKAKPTKMRYIIREKIKTFYYTAQQF